LSFLLLLLRRRLLLRDNAGFNRQAVTFYGVLQRAFNYALDVARRGRLTIGGVALKWTASPTRAAALVASSSYVFVAAAAVAISARFAPFFRVVVVVVVISSHFSTPP
jgi:hypothetical protein